MHFKKGLCFFLFVTALLPLATAPGRCQRENFDRIRADGGAPPAPPIPWPLGGAVIDSPYLNADGGAPPPPIPWPSSINEQSTLRADGGAPPPPIPWSSGAAVIDSPYLNADGGAPPPPIPWPSGNTMVCMS
jgi:hypothetical protein